jgi:RsiW-degrading membrane proteinase PrsW (M82 family)
MADHIKPSPANKMGTMKSTLLPIASNNITFDRGYLVVALATAAAVVLLILSRRDNYAFATILAYYVTFIQCVVIYYLCGRRELWPSMIGVFAFSYVALMMTSLFGNTVGPFRPQWVLAMMESPNMAARFIGHFIGAGAAEEFFKALPLFGLAILGLLCKSGPAHLRAISLTEPLDGIVLGVAAGAAFGLVEAVYVYYPDVFTSTANRLQGHPDDVRRLTGMMNAFQNVIVRLIGGVGGHMAYSGYFGYFIGLAVLRPKSAPLYLAIGFLTVCTLHGAWNAAVDTQPLLGMVVSFIGIAFLISAILKARRVSPTRSQNFATVAFPAAGVTPVAPPPVPAATAKPAPAATPRNDIMSEKAPPRAAGTLVLKIGPVECVVKSGVKIEPRMLGAAGAGRGRQPIAEVVAGEGASRCALKNLGERPWRARSSAGTSTEVVMGQAVALAAGTVIDFGGIEGIVQDN